MVDCVKRTFGWNWWYTLRGVSEGEYWFERFKIKVENMIERLNEAQEKLETENERHRDRMTLFIRRHGSYKKFKKGTRTFREWTRLKTEFAMQQSQIDRNNYKIMAYRNQLYVAEANAAVWDESKMTKAFVNLERRLSQSQGGVDGLLSVSESMQRAVENTEEIQIAAQSMLNGGVEFDDGALEDELDELFAEEADEQKTLLSVSSQQAQQSASSDIIGGTIVLPQAPQRHRVALGV